MKSRKDHVKVLMDYHREFYIDGSYPTNFSLQQKMLELGICPRCGVKSNRWSSSTGYFPCSKCGFKITENELDKVLDYGAGTSDKMMKSIMKRRLKQVRNFKQRRKNGK